MLFFAAPPTEETQFSDWSSRQPHIDIDFQDVEDAAADMIELAIWDVHCKIIEEVNRMVDLEEQRSIQSMQIQVTDGVALPVAIVGNAVKITTWLEYLEKTASIGMGSLPYAIQTQPRTNAAVLMPPSSAASSNMVTRPAPPSVSQQPQSSSIAPLKDEEDEAN